MRKAFLRLLAVPAKDPEDARKRRLLAFMTIGTVSSGIVTMVVSELLYLFFRPGKSYELTEIRIGIGIFITTGVLIYILNRRLSGPLPSLLFLICWMIFTPFVDTPQQVASGRSLFLYVLPIIISTVLLKPLAGFWFAGLSSLFITLIAFSYGGVPNVPAMGGFFMVALIAWLSGRSLEDAHNKLVQINKELDRRVTERTHELSEALNRERAEVSKNQAILESIRDGVMVLNNEGCAILANPAMERLAGCAAQEINGRRLPEVLSGAAELSQNNREAVLNFFRKTSSPQDYVKVRWGFETLVVSVAPVVIAGGEQIGQVAVFHNYSQQAEVERMKDDFIAMVSHELRTPLNSILGYVDMLREGVYGRPNGQQSGVYDRVTTNTRRLLAIVNDLLDQAQMESGRLVLHYRNFNPAELIAHMNSMVEGLVESKSLELTVHIANDLPRTLYGDPQRLGQVLVKLVNNAIKFTQSGFIAVRLVRLDSEHWAMEVSDTGIGISPEAQRYIFDTLRQVNMDATRTQGGIGLGLSIVKRLVVLMEGDLCLNSQVGKGSTFTVILPFETSRKEPANNEQNTVGINH